MKCQARKTNGEPCNGLAVNGRRVCRVHGGATPRPGPTHPNWKHGGRSKWVPARLADKYKESLNDPQLMEYRQDIALLESRLHELIASGESDLLWGKTQEAFHETQAAISAQDSARLAVALAELEALIGRGMADSLRWAEVYRVTEQIGRTKEREHKRLVQAQQMISVEQFLAMLGQIADAAKRRITNRDELLAFAGDLSQYGLVATGKADNGGH